MYLVSILVIVFAVGLGCGGEKDKTGTAEKSVAETNARAAAKAASQPARTASSPRRPEAPDFSVQGIDGKTIKFADYKGKVILLDFWASWCGPCKMSIPHLIDLYNEYKKDGFVVLGVSVDRGGMKAVKAFADKMAIPYPVGLDDGTVVGLYGGIRSIPTAFIIDREGYVQQRIIGYRPKAELERIITKYL